MSFEHFDGVSDYNTNDLPQSLPAPLHIPELAITRETGQRQREHEPEEVPIIRQQRAAVLRDAASLSVGATVGERYSELEEQQAVWDETAQALKANPIAYEGSTMSTEAPGSWLSQWVFNKTDFNHNTVETIMVEGRINERTLKNGVAEAKELLTAIELVNANTDVNSFNRKIMKADLLGVSRPGWGSSIEVPALRRRIAEVLPDYVYEYCVVRSTHDFTDGSWLRSGRTVPPVLHPQTPGLWRPQTYGFEQLERLLADLRSLATLPGPGDPNPTTPL